MDSPFHNIHARAPIPHTHPEISSSHQTPNLPWPQALPPLQNSKQPKKKGKGQTDARQYKPRRHDHEKMDNILAHIRDADWTLGEFLHKLFAEPGKQSATNTLGKKEKGVHFRTDSHRQFLSKFLSGSTKYSPRNIVELIYRNKLARPPYSHPDARQYFSVNSSSSTIEYARPALSTWALELVVAQIIKESTKLSSEQCSLRVRASQKRPKGPSNKDVATATDARGESIATNIRMDPEVLQGDKVDSGSEDGWDDIEDVPLTADGQVTEEESDDDIEDSSIKPMVDSSTSNTPLEEARHATEPSSMITQTQGTSATPGEDEAGTRTAVSWKIVSDFSFERLRRTYEDHAPTTWHILWKFVAPKLVTNRHKATRHVYRPKWIVSGSRSCRKCTILICYVCRL